MVQAEVRFGDSSTRNGKGRRTAAIGREHPGGVSPVHKNHAAPPQVRSEPLMPVNSGTSFAASPLPSGNIPQNFNYLASVRCQVSP